MMTLNKSNSNYGWAVVLTILFLWVVQVGVIATPQEKTDSMQYELLFNRKMLDNVLPDLHLIESMEITSSRLVMLSTNHQFYALGWGGIKPIGVNIPESISSFAYSSSGYLLTIRNKELCYVDSAGNMSTLVSLPESDMRISAGKKVMYIYDHNSVIQNHALYVLSNGGKYKQLFSVPSPIQAVTEFNNGILLASGNSLFSYNPKGRELKAIASLPDNKTIKSVAVDPSNNIIYYATDSLICALKDTTRLLISSQFGGTLKFWDGGLIVLNTDQKFLIRIKGIEKQIALMLKPTKIVPKEPSVKTEVLANVSVTNMVQNKLSDELIISIINRSKVNFDLSVNSMVYLAGQHVSSRVIMSMKQAMKNQSTGN